MKAKRRRKPSDEKHLRKKGRFWYIDMYINRKRIFKSTGHTRKSEAQKVLADYLQDKEYFIKKDVEDRKREILRKLRSINEREICEAWVRHIETVRDNKKEWLSKIWVGAQERSKAFKRPFSIKYDEWVDMALRSNGRCEITGIPFSFEIVNGTKRPPYMPSIDRIDSSLGYSYGNCRIVCLCVNLALNKWGDEVLERMAFGFLYKRIFHEFDGVINRLDEERILEA